MEAYEALIAGVLGLASLYAWQRRRDPMDKWLALVTLWICVTGSIGMVLAQFDDPWRYVRLALRLTGPPLLLVVCEESVRTRKTPGSRKTSLSFAAVVWVAAVGVLIWQRGGTITELQLPSQVPLIGNTQVGVTAWMAVLAICFLSALLTVIPSMTRGVYPGFAGIAATIILLSESWAAVDPRWGSGALSLSENLTYRSLLTFALAILGLAKAHSEGLTWLMSGAATDPPEGESKKPDKSKPKPKRTQVEKKKVSEDDEDSEEAEDKPPDSPDVDEKDESDEDDEKDDKRESKKPQKSKGKSSKSKKKKKKGKK